MQGWENTSRCPLTHVELTELPIVPQTWADRLDDPRAGAATSFVGTVRNHHEGKEVRYLEYSAHEEMAAIQLQRIVECMVSRWPLSGALIVHRLGRVDIGEVSVVVASAAAHRAEAFEACRYGIESLKKQVPIWKKEFYKGTEARWIGS